MPTDPKSQIVAIMPRQVQIPTATGMFISLQIQGDGTPTEDDMDATLQSLVDFLQEWPGRHPQLNVTGQNYQTRLFTVWPENALPRDDSGEPTEDVPPAEDPGEVVES